MIRKDDDELVITIRIREREKEDEGGDGDGDGPPSPTATPFLVLPFGAADVGQRPAPAAQALASLAVQALVTNPGAPQGWSDYAIELSCALTNLGGVASVAALAEFYVGEQFGIWNPAHTGLTPSQVKANAQLIGRASFVAPPGGSINFPCPNLWKPGSANDACKGVLVQVSDFFTDPVVMPFDAINDRHVARNDGLMNPIVHSVTVSGSLVPRYKIDVFPASVTFSNTLTGQQYTALNTDGSYSVLLPNFSTYNIAVLLEIAPRRGGSTIQVGSVSLNVTGNSYPLDIHW